MLLHRIKQLGNNVLNLFYPEVCLTCSALLHPQEKLICHHCLSEFPFTHYHLDHQNAVFERLSAIVKIEAASALLLFNESGIIKELIHQLKYQNRQEIGRFLAKLTIESLKNDAILSQIDYIVPVPLHPKKYKKRGYNQMSVFGKESSQAFKIPYDEKILIRTQNTDSQTKKNAAERRQNVANVFDIIQPEKYVGKHFLLIDDVMTTGATIESCAESILNKIPQAKVSVLTMAVVL